MATAELSYSGQVGNAVGFVGGCAVGGALVATLTCQISPLAAAAFSAACAIILLFESKLMSYAKRIFPNTAGLLASGTLLLFSKTVLIVSNHYMGGLGSLLMPINLIAGISFGFLVMDFLQTNILHTKQLI